MNFVKFKALYLSGGLLTYVTHGFGFKTNAVRSGFQIWSNFLASAYVMKIFIRLLEPTLGY